MDDLLKCVEALKADINTSIQDLNSKIESQAQNVANVLDSIEDHVPVTHIDGLFLNYKRYLKLITKQQQIYNEGLNSLIGYIGQAYKKGQAIKEGDFKNLYADAYKKGKQKGQEELQAKSDEAYMQGKREAEMEARAKYQDFEQCYIEYIDHLEDEKRELEAKIEELQSQPPPAKTKESSSIGKALEISGHQVEHIILEYVKESSTISKAAKNTGMERGQVTRIVKGQLKHPKSRKKVLKAVNALLKKNQNPKTIEKLHRIKDLYK